MLKRTGAEFGHESRSFVTCCLLLFTASLMTRATRSITVKGHASDSCLWQRFCSQQDTAPLHHSHRKVPGPRPPTYLQSYSFLLVGTKLQSTGTLSFPRSVPEAGTTDTMPSSFLGTCHSKETGTRDLFCTIRERLEEAPTQVGLLHKGGTRLVTLAGGTSTVQRECAARIHTGDGCGNGVKCDSAAP